MKNFGVKGAWAHQGTAVIFSVPPIILGTGKGTNFKLGTRIHRVHANKSPLKIKERRERGRIRGLPKFFEYPLLSQKGVKLRKFGRYIHSVHANKSPLKIGKKRAHGRIWGLPKIFQLPLLSQERVKLRTSSFVRTFLVSIGTKVHYKFRKK